MRLARILSQKSKNVYSVIRNPDQSQDIKDAGATPHVLSLEDDPVEKFTEVFVETNADVVVFSAGAGAEGEKEDRVRKVDYEGAVKVFDAIEAVGKVEGKKCPRFLLVSSIDIRNPDIIPEHYVSRASHNGDHGQQLIKRWGG